MTELPKTNVCLVTAVDVEFKTAIGLLTDTSLGLDSSFKLCRGRIGNRFITVMQCGMGAHGFAEWLHEHLQTNHYDTLIVAGLAGGLDPRLKTGDAVIYDCCLDARNDSTEISRVAHLEVGQVHNLSHQIEKANSDLTRTLLDAMRAASLNCFYGSGITTDRIVINAEDKLHLGQQHQALAVDMESFDVLRVANECNAPAVAVRVISDEAEHDLPDFNSATEPDGRINPRRMAAAMLQRPIASARFLRNLNSVFAALRTTLNVVLTA